MASAKKLDEFEAAVTALTNISSVESQAAVAQLATALELHRNVVRQVVDEFTREERRVQVVQDCDATIAAGNRDLHAVYAPVHQLIRSSDPEGMKQWEFAVAELDTKVVGDGQPRQRTADIAELYADAALVKPQFGKIVLGAAAAVNANSSDNDSKMFVELIHEPSVLKRTSRMVEKVELTAPPIGVVDKQQQLLPICDVVRAMFVGQGMVALAELVQAFISLAQDETITILRVKDRWQTPSSGGWRDLIINFRMRADEYRHVCEVQLVHRTLLTARRGFPGHTIYTRVRNASEILEKVGLMVPWEFEDQEVSNAKDGAAAWTLGAAVVKRRELGQSAADLLPLFGCTPRKLKLGGFTASELRDCGCTANLLKGGGYAAQELAEAGYSTSELEGAGFFHDELPHMRQKAQENYASAEQADKEAKHAVEKVQGELAQATEEAEVIRNKVDQAHSKVEELERSDVQRAQKLRKSMYEMEKRREEALAKVNELRQVEKERLQALRAASVDAVEAPMEIEWAASVAEAAENERKDMEQRLASLVDQSRSRELALREEAERRFAIDLKKAQAEVAKQLSDAMEKELERLEKESAQELAQERDRLQAESDKADAARSEVEQDAKAAQSKLQKVLKESSRLSAATQRAKEQLSGAQEKGEKNAQLATIRERVKLAEDKERRHKDEISELVTQAENLQQAAEETVRHAEYEAELGQKKLARREAAHRERRALMRKELQQAAQLAQSTKEAAVATAKKVERIEEEIRSLRSRAAVAVAQRQVADFRVEGERAQAHLETMRKVSEDSTRRLKEAKKRGDQNVEALRRAQALASWRHEEAVKEATTATEALRASEWAETACTAEMRVAEASLAEHLAVEAEQEKEKDAQHVQMTLDAAHMKLQMDRLQADAHQARAQLNQMRSNFQAAGEAQMRDMTKVLKAQEAKTLAADNQTAAAQLSAKATQEVNDMLKKRMAALTSHLLKLTQEQAAHMKQANQQRNASLLEVAASRSLLEIQRVEREALEARLKIATEEVENQIALSAKKGNRLHAKLVAVQAALAEKVKSEASTHAQIAEMAVTIDRSDAKAKKLESALAKALKDLTEKTKTEQQAQTRNRELEIEVTWASRSIEFLKRNLDEANDSVMKTASSPNASAYVAAEKRIRVVSYELSQHHSSTTREKEQAAKSGAESLYLRVQERIGFEKKSKYDIDVLNTELAESLAEAKSKSEENTVNHQRRMEWQAEQDAEEAALAQAADSVQVTEARTRIEEHRTQQSQQLEKLRARAKEEEVEQKKASEAKLVEDNARLDAKMVEEVGWIDEQKAQLEEQLEQFKEAVTEATQRTSAALQDKKRCTQQIQEAQKERQQREADRKQQQEQFEQQLAATKEEAGVNSKMAEAQLQASYADNTAMAEWETAQRALSECRKIAEAESQRASAAQAKLLKGDTALWLGREQIWQKGLLKKVEAAVGERAPDVTVDLVRRQLVLNQAFVFLENRSVFADENAAMKLLQQIAVVAHLCDALLDRAGRAQLMLNFEGHNARDGPYYRHLASDRARLCWREVLRRYGELAGRAPFEGMYSALAAKGRDYERRFIFTAEPNVQIPLGGGTIRVELEGADDDTCRTWANSFEASSNVYPFSSAISAAEVFTTSRSAVDMLTEIQRRRIAEGGHTGHLTITLSAHAEDGAALHVYFPNGKGGKHHIFDENIHAGGGELDLRTNVSRADAEPSRKVLVNVFFKEPPEIAGTYEVWLCHRGGAVRGKGHHRYVVVIEIDGEMQTLTGVIGNEKLADEVMKSYKTAGDEKRDVWLHVADIMVGHESVSVSAKDATIDGGSKQSYLRQEGARQGKSSKLAAR